MGLVEFRFGYWKNKKMCGRFTQTNLLKELQTRFGFGESDIFYQPNYNIAPGQDIPVIVNENGNQLKLMKWGLVPSWAKDKKIGYKMINARSETLEEKPAFRDSFKQKRCIIPADGFFEWKQVEGQKTKLPYRAILSDGGLFAMAGLWDCWKDPDSDETLETFTIITTEANEKLQPIHHRMPVILEKSLEKTWLDPTQDLKTLKEILNPISSEKMSCFEVSTMVNSPKHNLPEVIEAFKNPVFEESTFWGNENYDTEK